MKVDGKKKEKKKGNSVLSLLSPIFFNFLWENNCDISLFFSYSFLVNQNNQKYEKFSHFHNPNRLLL